MAQRDPFTIIPSIGVKGASIFTIEAEDYGSYFDTTPGNIGGVYRNDDVDIEPTTDVRGGFNVGWIAEGEWLTYDLEEATDGFIPSNEKNEVFLLDIRVASELDTTHSLDISLDGQTTTLSFDGTGGEQSWDTVIGGALNLTAGIHTLRLDMGSSGFNINYINFQGLTSSSSGLQLIGTEDGDILIGGDNQDVLVGEAGDDTLWGGEGEDSLYGESGDNTFYLGLGNDLLYGEDGNDILYGGAGNDTLSGGDGNDTLWAEEGNDNLLGGAGNDSLWAGIGNDTLSGGGYSQEPEIDVLEGHSFYLNEQENSTTFVIGDSKRFAYMGGSIDDQVDYSYAIIYPRSDNYYIQAHGTAIDYELDYNDWDSNSIQDTGIYLGNDLLAVVMDETLENFDQFIFVSDVFI